MKHSHWGVVGLGRAGQARIKAIDARPHLSLAGTVGRRPERGTTTLDALCADPAVDGVVICSENAHHAPAARRVLEAGKHAIVEFPLAGGADEAAELFALARARGRILHTELIGLLTARHRAARDLCRTAPVAGLSVHFTGGSYRWVADEIAAGRIGQLAIGRLHALHDLLGPLTLDDVECVRDGERYRLVARFTGVGGARIVLDERRGPELKRGSRMTGQLADGRPFAPAARDEPGDLFGQDFERALGRIAGDPDAAYVDDEAVVAMLRLAERISGHLRDAAPR